MGPQLFSDGAFLCILQADSFLYREAHQKVVGRAGTGKGMRPQARSGPHTHAALRLMGSPALSLGWLCYCVYG